ARHPGEVEPVEGAPEVLALAQDGEPGQPRLEAFQAELLEEPLVLGHRTAPLLVVIVLVVRQARLPPAAPQAVTAEQQSVVRSFGHAERSAALRRRRRRARPPGRWSAAATRATRRHPRAGR